MEPLVSTDWLHKQLGSKESNIVILDTTWFTDVEYFPFKDAPATYMKSKCSQTISNEINNFMETILTAEPNAQRLYNLVYKMFSTLTPDLYWNFRAHIPGARHLDLDAGVNKTKLLPRNLPDRGVLQEHLRSLGVNNGSDVVLYDRDDGVELITVAACRAWFVLKAYGVQSVAILDGGLPAWERKGYPTEKSDCGKFEPGDVVLNFTKEMFVDYEEMKKIEHSGSHQILDSRLTINFNGEEPEPCPFIRLILDDVKVTMPSKMKTGHMQNAKNIPFSEAYSDDLTFKDVDGLRKMFSDAGIDLERPLVTTCYMGHTAALMAFLATLCGKFDTILYSGSWTEYGQLEAE